jgi:hypothetical protein
MPNFTAGTSFGANDTVTNTKLNALIADATINPEYAVNINTGTIGTLSCTRGTVQTLTASTLTGTLTGGTYTGVVNSSATSCNFTAGTIGAFNSTSGTINSTLSTIGTLVGTNNSTIAGITVGTRGNSGGFTFTNNVFGHTSSTAMSSGSYNSAFGYGSLQANTTGTANSANGALSLYSNVTGSDNSAFGYNALFSPASAGSRNSAFGVGALYSSSGSANTAVGYNALNVNSSYVNSTGLGANAAVAGSNQVQLGDSATRAYAYGALIDRSDIRDKADVKDTNLGLEFIKELRPVDFKWDMREDYKPSFDKDADPEIYKLANITHDGSKKRNRYHHGLIAQEVKEVLDRNGIDFGGYQDYKIKGGDDVLGIGYTELIAPMIKAIQQLSAKVDSLEAQLASK